MTQEKNFYIPISYKVIEETLKTFEICSNILRLAGANDPKEIAQTKALLRAQLAFYRDSDIDKTVSILTENANAIYKEVMETMEDKKIGLNDTDSFFAIVKIIVDISKKYPEAKTELSNLDKPEIAGLISTITHDVLIKNNYIIKKEK